MALSTYTELKAAVASYLHRADLTTPIVDFITIGEQRLISELKVREMETQSSVNTVAGTATVALPTGYQGARWLYVATDPKRKLEYASGEQLYQTYSGSTNGIPRVYTVSGSNWLFGPTPDGVYVIDYLIYVAPTVLSGSTATNTLFPTYNYLYLYAALVEAAVYLDDTESLTKYEQLYQRFLRMANASAEEERFSGSTLRVRPDRAGP